MARKKRLTPNQRAELKDDLAGLKSISNYNPAKPEFRAEIVEGYDNELDELEIQIAQTEAHLSDLRNQAADKSVQLLKGMKGARQQVIAQFGDDSPEYESVGGTRTSNRRPPKRKPKGNNSENN